MKIHRIWMYAPFPTGGHPKYVAELLSQAVHVMEADQTVELVSSRDLDPAYVGLGYPVHRILPSVRALESFRSRPGRLLSRLLLNVRREFAFQFALFKGRDVDVVHFQELPTWLPFLTVAAVKGQRRRVCLTAHNVTPHAADEAEKGMNDRALRLAYSLCDVIFVHSAGLAEQMTSLLAERRMPRIVVVEHGVWSDGMPNDTSSNLDRLARRRLLSFGAVRRDKGVHLLLEAAACGMLPGCSITIAGPIVESRYYHQTVLPLVRDCRASGTSVTLRAEYVPEVEVGPLFAAHSAVVIPYLAEFQAQSGVLFSAISHKVPVVATDCGGVGQLMRERRLGELSSGHSPAEIAQATERLLSYGRNELNDVLDVMEEMAGGQSWRQMAMSTAAEYSKLVGARRG